MRSRVSGLAQRRGYGVSGRLIALCVRNTLAPRLRGAAGDLGRNSGPSYRYKAVFPLGCHTTPSSCSLSRAT